MQTSYVLINDASLFKIKSVDDNNNFKIPTKSENPKGLDLGMCYLHIEGYNELYTMDINKLPISKCLWDYNQSTLLLKNLINEGKGDWIVVLPIYLSGKNKQYLISDLQIAVTGKCRYVKLKNGGSRDESSQEAKVREIKEELGFITVPTGGVTNATPFQLKTLKGNTFTSITEPSEINSGDLNLSYELFGDNKSRRVQTWYAVQKTDENLNAITKRSRTKNSGDKAGEVVAIFTVNQLKQILEYSKINRKFFINF